MNGIKALIETGEIGKMPLPDRANASGFFEPVMKQFRKEHPGVVFSISPEEDAAYMDAVKKGDEEKTADMVNKALDEYLKEHSYTRDDVAKVFGNIMNRHEGDYEIFGIRFDNRMLVPEEVFPKSHELFQDYMEDENGEQLYPDGEGYYEGYYDAGELDGTSTIWVGRPEEIADALGTAYNGKYVYLVVRRNQFTFFL